MEQFRQIGEVVGRFNAIMVFRENIQINQRQCCLLADMFTSAYTKIAEEIKKNLRFEEKNSKWKILECPLREILRVFREGETYINQCLEVKDWFVKSILLYNNKDCVEHHIHNLMNHLPIVIEAIEIAGEISGFEDAEMQKKRYVYSSKYQKECRDPNIFQWKFGDQYVITQGLCNRIASAFDEDRFFLRRNLQERKESTSSSTNDCTLVDALLRSLEFSDKLSDKLLPRSILVKSSDYQVRRRLGGGSQYKEIHWLGESFALRQILGDFEEVVPNPLVYFDLSHPNIMNVLCGFSDEEKREHFVVMELMSKDLSTYVEELCGTKKRVPFSRAASIDLMLQIARGMEYLHHKKIYHGDLNPFNILIEDRNVSSDGYVQAKVSGFGLSSCISFAAKAHPTKQNVPSPFIWYAPEVLAEQENSLNAVSFHPSEKADVYSFGMVCFEILTGKVPFGDSHLQGDEMSTNVKAGERPLFPSSTPKYTTNLTKKCWHADPNQRPSFSSICRTLRYMKKFVVMNPDCNQHDPSMEQIDYNDIETRFLGCFPSLSNSEILQPVTEIPFQMFAYKVGEKEESNPSSGETFECVTEVTPIRVDGNVTSADDRSPSPSPPLKKPSPEGIFRRLLSGPRKFAGVKSPRQPETPKGLNSKPTPTSSRGRGRGHSTRVNFEIPLSARSTKTRRKPGNLSDSELLLR